MMIGTARTKTKKKTPAALLIGYIISFLNAALRFILRIHDCVLKFFPVFAITDEAVILSLQLAKVCLDNFLHNTGLWFRA